MLVRVPWNALALLLWLAGSCVQRLVALGVSEETAQEALDRMRGLPLPELKGRYVSACLCLARYSTVHMEVLRSLPLGECQDLRTAYAHSGC